MVQPYRSPAGTAEAARGDEKDISVDIDGGALVVQAERHEKEEDKKKKYVIRESSSSFYRRIALPEQANQGEIEAHFSKACSRSWSRSKNCPRPRRSPSQVDPGDEPPRTRRSGRN